MDPVGDRKRAATVARQRKGRKMFAALIIAAGIVAVIAVALVRDRIDHGNWFWQLHEPGWVEKKLNRRPLIGGRN